MSTRPRASVRIYFEWTEANGPHVGISTHHIATKRCGMRSLPSKTTSCIGEFADCIPTILDLRRRELFVAELLPPMIGVTVASELAWADGFFQSVRKGGIRAFVYSRAWPFARKQPVGQISVQPRVEKYFASLFGRNSFMDSNCPVSLRGAARDRHGREAGCGGRSSVLRAIELQGRSKGL